MKQFFWILGMCFVFIFITPRSEAHVGGGPPFLKINGYYAQTNPYFQGMAAFNVTQDLAPNPKYKIHTPIHFSIDTDKLSIPPEIANHSTFRWSVAKNETFLDKTTDYKYGQEIDLTFDKEGSYLVILEAHAAGEYEFNVIDTVQMNIVSNMAYQLPKVAIIIGTQSTSDHDPVKFVSQTQFDRSVKTETYFWDLGDDKLQRGQEITGNYTHGQPLSYVYHRVIDDHGFVADVGFDVWDTNGTLEFHPFGNMPSAPIRVKPASDIPGQVTTKKVSPLAYLLIIPVIVLITFMVLLLKRK